MAALRTGAGLATVAVPRSILPTVAGFLPELMTEPLAESDAGTISGLALEQVLSLAAGKTVLAIGPGASMHPETATFMRALVADTQTPTILDADGLNAFAGHVDQLNGKLHPLVLTPHPGELARLNGMSVPQIQADRIATARRFAQQCHAYVVLKGHRTVIAEPDGKVWINTTGNAGMATGGTGDILTGMISGLVAQFPADVPTCVLAAVHLHGMAGNLAVQELGEMPLVATDLLRFLPQALRQGQAA
jgi:ADP-dependent NAD(P)H-hydrate dehydratase / NAD(P)H-hydrate epimerase